VATAACVVRRARGDAMDSLSRRGRGGTLEPTSLLSLVETHVSSRASESRAVCMVSSNPNARSASRVASCSEFRIPNRVNFGGSSEVARVLSCGRGCDDSSRARLRCRASVPTRRVRARQRRWAWCPSHPTTTPFDDKALPSEQPTASTHVDVLRAAGKHELCASRARRGARVAVVFHTRGGATDCSGTEATTKDQGREKRTMRQGSW